MIAFDYSYENITNTTIEERFKVKFKPIRWPVKPWKEELLVGVRNIVESTNKPIYVLMSGGIDSEIVARILMDLNINFKVLTVRYEYDLNKHDTNYAIRFCEKYNIEQEIVYLNAKEFYSTGIEKYIEQGYRARNIYHYLQLFLLEQLERLGGFGIGGAGEQVYYTINNEVCIRIRPDITLGLDFCKNNNINHHLWLNLSSSEVYGSYLKTDLIELLTSDNNYYINPDYNSVEKILLCHRFWPEMERRNKYTGFEHLEETIRIPKQKELGDRFPDLEYLYIPIKKIKEELKL